MNDTEQNTPLSPRLYIWNVPTKKYIIKILSKRCKQDNFEYGNRMRALDDEILSPTQKEEIKAKKKITNTSTVKKCDPSHNWKRKWT